MADIDKVLYDDHAKVKRMFSDFERGGTIDLALSICHALRVHAAVEEDVLYPVLRDEVDSTAADQAEEDHEQIEELVNEIEESQPGGRELKSLMAELKQTLMRHVEYEEGTIFPRLNQQIPDELMDMGRAAFAKRQEVLQDMPQPKAVSRSGLANAGW